jgi:hypothetical protein
MLVKFCYWSYSGDRGPQIVPSRATFWWTLLTEVCSGIVSWIQTQRILRGVCCVQSGTDTGFYVGFVVYRVAQTQDSTWGLLCTEWHRHRILRGVWCVQSGTDTGFYVGLVVYRLAQTQDSAWGLLCTEWHRHKILRGVCCVQSGTDTGFSRVLRFSPHNYYSTIASHSFILRSWDVRC